MAPHAEITLEEFKARLPLAEVVGRYVRLTKAGREYRGLCPFHKEKTPSFHVVEDKGFYHCFGCGAHGTAIDFVMGVENLDFGAALDRLADLTGIAAPRRRADPEQAEANARLYAANEAAAAWFARQLEQDRSARSYVERRGLDRQQAVTFQLGYAPDDRQGLRRALLDKGFTETELLAAGLLAMAEDDPGRGSFDRFRNRLMFPIADERGRIVGFGGRALGDARAKYLNTPETALFHKGELLYNLHRAAPAARQRREIVLAEGYMDVIALARAGLEHTVAPLGTAVTERQLGLLWRYAEAPIVCLDGDRAGLGAALRAAERALPLMQGGRSLRFALLPEGEDPDSYLARHGGAALAAVLARAQSLSQTLWRLETQGRRFEAPEDQAALRRRLRGYTRLVADPDLRVSLDGHFNQLLDGLFPRRRPGWGKGKVPDQRNQPSLIGASRLTAGLLGVSSLGGEDLLGPVLVEPGLLDGYEEDFAALELSDPGLSRLRDEILLWSSDNSALDASELAQHLNRHGLASERDRVLASVAKVRQKRGETTAWPSAEEWKATLVRGRLMSARHRQRASFVESVLSGEPAGLTVNRTSLDQLLNREAESEAGGTSSPGPLRRNS